MIKVFSIIKETSMEHEINMLIEKGVSYISEFEKVFGIVGYCNDIEIFFNNKEENTESFLIINGSEKIKMLENCFIEKGAKIITIESLKHIMAKYNESSTKSFYRIGYKVELFLAGYRVWRINSDEKQIA